MSKKPGAGGCFGTGLAPQSPAGGYTCCVGTSWVVNPTYAKLPYYPFADFRPVIARPCYDDRRC